MGYKGNQKGREARSGERASKKSFLDPYTSPSCENGETRVLSGCDLGWNFVFNARQHNINLQDYFEERVHRKEKSKQVLRPFSTCRMWLTLQHTYSSSTNHSQETSSHASSAGFQSAPGGSDPVSSQRRHATTRQVSASRKEAYMLYPTGSKIRKLARKSYVPNNRIKKVGHAKRSCLSCVTSKSRHFCQV